MILNIRISELFHEKLKKLAKKRDMSVTSLSRTVIDRRMKKKKRVKIVKDLSVKNRVFTIQMAESLKNRVVEHARVSNVTTSDYVRSILIEETKENENE